MPLPTVAKTWVKTFNTILDVSSNLTRTQKLFFDLKSKMAAAGWTVTSSSDATTLKNFGDGSPDTWLSYTDLNWGSGSSSQRSWIILENVALSLSVLFDYGTTYEYQFNMYVSMVGFGVANGGVDGSLTSRPTATDEHSYLNLDGGLGRAGSTRIVTHAWHTSDGKQFRFWARSNGTTNGSAWVLFGEPGNPPDLWSDPAIYQLVFNYNGGNVPLSDSFYKVAGTRAVVDGSFYTMYLTGETFGLGDAPMSLIRSVSPSTLSSDSGYLLQPIGLLGLSAGVRGSNGRIPDMWWGPMDMGDGDTLPANGSRQFVKLGDVCLPWDGSVPVIE